MVVPDMVTKTKLNDLDGIKKYICEKFGDDCYLALLVVHAENGTLACDRVSPKNKNGTVDRGLWQLNSAYYDFEPDCYKNTDKAYEIYKSRGNTFDRWSTYNNGSYKRFIGKI
jgi:hypothetical protein